MNPLGLTDQELLYASKIHSPPDDTYIIYCVKKMFADPIGVSSSEWFDTATLQIKEDKQLKLQVKFAIFKNFLRLHWLYCENYWNYNDEFCESLFTYLLSKKIGDDIAQRFVSALYQHYHDNDRNANLEESTRTFLIKMDDLSSTDLFLPWFILITDWANLKDIINKFEQGQQFGVSQYLNVIMGVALTGLVTWNVIEKINRKRI
jgi:hypothetical protein